MAETMSNPSNPETSNPMSDLNLSPLQLSTLAIVAEQSGDTCALMAEAAEVSASTMRDRLARLITLGLAESFDGYSDWSGGGRAVKCYQPTTAGEAHRDSLEAAAEANADADAAPSDDDVWARTVGGDVARTELAIHKRIRESAMPGSHDEQRGGLVPHSHAAAKRNLLPLAELAELAGEMAEYRAAHTPAEYRAELATMAELLELARNAHRAELTELGAPSEDDTSDKRAHRELRRAEVAREVAELAMLRALEAEAAASCARSGETVSAGGQCASAPAEQVGSCRTPALQAAEAQAASDPTPPSCATCGGAVEAERQYLSSVCTACAERKAATPQDTPPARPSWRNLTSNDDRKPMAVAELRRAAGVGGTRARTTCVRVSKDGQWVQGDVHTPTAVKRGIVVRLPAPTPPAPSDPPAEYDADAEAAKHPRNRKRTPKMVRALAELRARVAAGDSQLCDRCEAEVPEGTLVQVSERTGEAVCSACEAAPVYDRWWVHGAARAPFAAGCPFKGERIAIVATATCQTTPGAPGTCYGWARRDGDGWVACTDPASDPPAPAAPQDTPQAASEHPQGDGQAKGGGGSIIVSAKYREAVARLTSDPIIRKMARELHAQGVTPDPTAWGFISTTSRVYHARAMEGGATEAEAGKRAGHIGGPAEAVAIVLAEPAQAAS